MNLTPEQIAKLIEQISVTREKEADCDQCFHAMAEYAERELGGKTITEGLKIVEAHLQLCEECREEYGMLLAALRKR